MMFTLEPELERLGLKGVDILPIMDGHFTHYHFGWNTM